MATKLANDRSLGGDGPRGSRGAPAPRPAALPGGRRAAPVSRASALETEHARLQATFETLSKEHDSIVAERDRVRAMEALVARESEDAGRTVFAQAEKVTNLQQQIANAEVKHTEQQAVFDSAIERLTRERDELQHAIDELRISGYDRKRTELILEEQRRECQTMRAQLAHEVRDKEALERRYAEIIEKKKEDLEVLRVKLGACQAKAKHDKGEKERKIDNLTVKVQEMQENLSRQDRQLEDLRRGIEEERKRRPVERHITPEEEGEELTSELARWTAVADEAEAKCLRLQSRLTDSEATLHDQKTELKDALSFLKQMRSQGSHAGLLTKSDGT